MPEKPPIPPAPPEDSLSAREGFKHGRRAAALRENLARRKAQARARQAPPEPTCPPGHRSPPSENES